MRRLIPCLVLLAILSQAAFASIFLTYPNTHTVTVNQPRQFSIEVLNNNSNDIFLVDFSQPQFFTIDRKQNITAFQSKNITATITTNQLFSQQQFISLFSFTTKTTGERERQQITISINLTSISNNNAQIFKNDGVRFQNTGNIDLLVRRNDSVPQFTIPANSFIDRNFTAIVEFNYFIEQSGFIGRINVQDNIIDQFIHDPSGDQSLTFTVSSINSPAQLTISAPLNSFIMNHNSTQEGVLILNSNETVFNLNLQATKWIEFEENNFNFFGNKVVKYHITPTLNSTNETGKVHPIELTASASNANPVTAPINVFINEHQFSSFSGSNNSINFVFADEDTIRAFCEARPEQCLLEGVVAAYCRFNPEACPTQEVLRNRSLTDEGRFLEELNEKSDRTLNKIVQFQQEQLPSMDARLASLEQGYKNLNDQQEGARQAKIDAEVDAKTKRFWRWVFGIFVLIAVGITGTVFYMRYRASGGLPS